MIDCNLIEQCKASIVHALQQRQTTQFGCVFQIDSVLSDSMIHKLKQYVHTVSADKWSAVPGQEHNNRRAIVWDPDTVIEELHESFAGATAEVDAFFHQPLNFLGIQLWTDGHGYHTGLHQDNKTIDVSCQIYLFDNDPQLGTTFQRHSDTVVVPYKNNSGYLMINNRDTELYHTSSCKTPPGITRYSIYAVWSLTPKQ